MQKRTLQLGIADPIGSDDGQLYACNAQTGQQLWAQRLDDQVESPEVFSSPTVVSGTVYVGWRDTRLYALDVSSGAVKWSAGPSDYTLDTTPAVADGMVYIAGAWGEGRGQGKGGILYAVRAL